MGRRDHYCKRLLDDPKVVTDICNYFLCNSHVAISLNDVHRLDGEQSVVFGRKIDRRMRDRLWRVSFTYGDRICQFILGVELQSEISYDMPVRVMHYDALSYAYQVKVCEAQHRQNADFSDAGAFLSGIMKDDKLIPVVTVVLYFGKSLWDGAVKFSDMLVIVPCKMMQALIHDPVLHLIDPHQLTEHQLLRLQSELREVFAFIKYADDRQKLMRFLNRHCKDRTISGNAVNVINVFTKAKIRRSRKQEDIQMCQAIIELKEEARAAGKREGKREGIREGKLENLLANIRSLSKTMGLSYEEAMKALRVPKAKREELLKMLPAT